MQTGDRTQRTRISLILTLRIGFRAGAIKTEHGIDEWYDMLNNSTSMNTAKVQPFGLNYKFNYRYSEFIERIIIINLHHF